MHNEYLLTIDRDDVADFSTAQLREAAEKVDLFSRRDSVATLPIGSAEVVGKPGTLTVLDKTITALIAAYSERGATVTTSYSGSICITVWATDATLRENLRYQIERARETAGSFNGG